MTSEQERMVCQALWRCFCATGADVSPWSGMYAWTWAHEAVEAVEEIVARWEACLDVLDTIHEGKLLAGHPINAQVWDCLNYVVPFGQERP